MLPKKPRRADADTLIWEYLDGEISPRRANTLTSLLTRRAGVRKRLVDSAMLQGMLIDYYRGESAGQPDLQADDAQAQPTHDRRSRPRRRKHGRSSAA